MTYVRRKRTNSPIIFTSQVGEGQEAVWQLTLGATFSATPTRSPPSVFTAPGLRDGGHQLPLLATPLSNWSLQEMSTGSIPLGGFWPSALAPMCCLPPLHIRLFFQLPDSQLQAPAPDTETTAPRRLYNLLYKVESYHILTISIYLNSSIIRT